MVALLAVAIVHLTAREDGLQRDDRETVPHIVVLPLRLPRAVVVQHVGVRYQRSVRSPCTNRPKLRLQTHILAHANSCKVAIFAKSGYTARIN